MRGMVGEKLQTTLDDKISRSLRPSANSLTRYTADWAKCRALPQV